MGSSLSRRPEPDEGLDPLGAWGTEGGLEGSWVGLRPRRLPLFPGCRGLPAACPREPFWLEVQAQNFPQCSPGYGVVTDPFGAWKPPAGVDPGPGVGAGGGSSPALHFWPVTLKTQTQGVCPLPPVPKSPRGPPGPCRRQKPRPPPQLSRAGNTERPHVPPPSHVSWECGCSSRVQTSGHSSTRSIGGLFPPQWLHFDGRGAQRTFWLYLTCRLGGKGPANGPPWRAGAGFSRSWVRGAVGPAGPAWREWQLG